MMGIPAAYTNQSIIGNTTSTSSSSSSSSNTSNTSNNYQNAVHSNYPGLDAVPSNVDPGMIYNINQQQQQHQPQYQQHLNGGSGMSTEFAGHMMDQRSSSGADEVHYCSVSIHFSV